MAALPINLIKALRDELATAAPLIDSGEWTKLRDILAATTGSKLTKLEEGGKFTKVRQVQLLTVKLRKTLFDLDKFAYSQQSFPGSDVFGGYCADGVVPRDAASGCKVKPQIDKAPLKAALTAALTTFDELIAACGA